MTDTEPSMWKELDALPPTPRPAVAFVTLVTVAEEAARAALDAACSGKEERAVSELEHHIHGMRPSGSPDTLDAWTRSGAVAGVVAAWMAQTGTIPVYTPPHPCPSDQHAAVHCSAWTLAVTIVTGVRYE